MNTTWQDTCGTLLALSLVAGLALGSAPTQAQPRTDLAQPYASPGGKVELSAPRNLPEAADPVNQRVLAQTADGLVLVVTVDGATITLDSATPARVPRRVARSERATDGPTVKATGYAGGQIVATTVLPDTLYNASEGDGLVRTERRQIALVLVADRPLDSVTVEAPATGARATLNVSAAYARYCDADRNSPWCPKARD